MTAAERAREKAQALVDTWLTTPTTVERGKPFTMRGGFPTQAFDRLADDIASALLAHEAEVIERCAHLAECWDDGEIPEAIAAVIRDSGREKEKP